MQYSESPPISGSAFADFSVEQNFYLFTENPSIRSFIIAFSLAHKNIQKKMLLGKLKYVATMLLDMLLAGVCFPHFAFCHIVVIHKHVSLTALSWTCR